MTSRVLERAGTNPSFDALVIGAGIAGLETALDLGDQGFQVAIVERKPSIGGAMIGLSKVFPTLDCSSCITTPKMAAAAHHPNIAIYTYTEVLSVERRGPAIRRPAEAEASVRGRRRVHRLPQVRVCLPR